MNILVVISKHDLSHRLLKEKIASCPAKLFIFCPIHAGLEEKVDELKQMIEKGSSAQYSVVPFSRRLLEHSLKVKDEYISWISQLGSREVFPGVSLKEFFRYRCDQFSLWWLSLVYEKSPGKTDAFLHFVKTSLLSSLAQENRCTEIWMCANEETGKYYSVLSGFTRFQTVLVGSKTSQEGGKPSVFIMGREMLRVVRYLSFLVGVCLGVKWQKRPVIPSNVKCFAITMFPFLDQKKFDNKIFSTKAYGPLQDTLEAHGPVVWLAMHTKIHPYSWQDSLRLAGAVKKFSRNFFSLDDWIGFKDIVLIVFDFVRMALRFLSIFNRLENVTQFQTKDGQKVNLWHLLREDFVSSFAGKVAVVNLHYFRIFTNLIKDVPQGSTIVHFAEMHAWERSLQMIAQSRGIKVIAIQHAHVPQLLLNYFDNSSDLRDDNFMHSVPQPHVLGSVGRVIQGYFYNQGWPKDKLFIIGGFRFQSLLALQSAMAQKSDGKDVLVAAFSICANENSEMLNMLYKAFNDGSQKVRILIKSHPAEPVERMVQQKKLQLNADVFEFTQEPLEKIVPSSMAMFACSTSAVFYAMACRKPVIVPCQFDAIDLCPLTNLYDYETRVDDVKQLKAVFNEIRTGQYNFSRHESYRSALFKDYLNLERNFAEQFEIINSYLN